MCAGNNKNAEEENFEASEILKQEEGKTERNLEDVDFTRG